MKRRGFISSIIGGVAAAVVAPFLARRTPDFLDEMRADGLKWAVPEVDAQPLTEGSIRVCPHYAFHSGPGIDGVRCLECGEKIAQGSAWDGQYIAFGDTRIDEDYRRLPGWRRVL